MNDIKTIVKQPINPHFNQLISGDCIEVMKRLPRNSVNLIVTDPPYVVRYKSRDGRSLLNDDNTRWIEPAFSQMYRVLAHDSFCISFYGWNHVDTFMRAWRKAGFTPVGHFVFSKPYSSKTHFTGSRHECAYLLAKGRPLKPTKPLNDVLGWKYSGNRLHPTQKPLPQLCSLIESYSQLGDVVLDPFAGSGSTAVASKMLSRKYIAIELDKKYYDVARMRIRALLGRQMKHVA